jgi:serine protease Do
MNDFNENVNTEPVESEEQRAKSPYTAPTGPAPTTPNMPQNTAIPTQEQQKMPVKETEEVSQKQVPPYTPPKQENQYYRYNPQQQPPQGYPQRPPYGFPPPQGQPDYYSMNYGVPKPPKEKMSGGLKAFLIVALSLLGACLIGFIAYVAINSGNSQQDLDSFSNDYSFTMPSGYSGQYTVPTETTSSDNNFTQSDAQKETDPSYSGVKLESKPKNTSNSKYNASYSFNNLQSSVVGVICYNTEDTTTETYASQGTGIVLTSDGYIVTNSHVIGNSRTKYVIKIVTADKKEYTAGVVGYDSRTDLAVLKADAKGLTPATFGNSDEIEVTEDVIAIGNPRGINYQNSVTKGIVSAVNRVASTTNNAKFIQTDTAINPGNSGGPLCNMYGQVIGITTSKVVMEEYEGMGFAIPSSTVKKIVDDIIKYNHVTGRVKIGIVGSAVSSTTSDVKGIQISEITDGGPMDGSGAEVSDIITSVDGTEVSTFAEVYDVLEKHKAGDKVRINLYRPSTDKTYDITIELQADE